MKVSVFPSPAPEFKRSDVRNKYYKLRCVGSKQKDQMIRDANKGINFSQNFAVLPALDFCSTAGYTPAWHVICFNLGRGFQVQRSSKTSGGANGKLYLSKHQRCSGCRNN